MPAKQNRVTALYLRVNHILEIGKKVLDLQKTWRYFVELPKDAEVLPQNTEDGILDLA
jgi:hypothetical protein